jgi:hypothetical protein
MLQLRTYREEFTVYYIPDDATAEEVAELAAEHRALAVIHNNGNTGDAMPAGTAGT